MSRSLAFGARALTLSRILGLPAFGGLLTAAARTGEHAFLLAGLYLFFALSDFLDGPLARRGGVASARWGRIDALADILFNAGSLAAAAWAGLVGPWVPAGVLALGGRYLWRVALSSSDPEQIRLPQDRPGNLAGVLFYALVGLIVAEVAFGPLLGRWFVARVGDGVFLYTLWVLWPRNG